MERYIFKLPDIGEGIAEAEIVAWHIAVGDEIAEDQPIADMMTDKATVEMESPVSGRVVELAGEVGDQVPIGAMLVVLEVESTSPAGQAVQGHSAAPFAEPTDTQLVDAPARAAGPSSSAKADEAGGEHGRPRSPQPNRAAPGEPATPRRADAGQHASSKAPARIRTSPAVRQRARDLGVALSQVRTVGDRIRHSDLDAYLLYHGGFVGNAPARRADEVIKVVGLRRKIAENMAEAKRRIPHFTLVEEVDVTALESTRAMMNADRGDNPKATILPFLIRAMSSALGEFPQINARYDDEAQIVTRLGAVHMGVATQTPAGLMVPVIRNADRLDTWELAGEIARLADAARAGTAHREELSGSTITISSLGPLGGIASTPVINRPEVAILAVNKIEEKPVVADGEVQVRKRMNLSLSCDHRVVDGWDAALFMQSVKALIEQPLRLLSP